MHKGVHHVLPLAQWAENSRKRKEATYLLYPFIPTDSMVVLSGVPKEAKKTLLAMSMAMMIATGRTVDFMQVKEPQDVIYVYEEGDIPGTLRRFEALAKGHNLGPVDEMHRLHFAHRMGFSLDSAEDIETMIAFARQKNAKLIVIDTLAKCMRGDENNVQAVGHTINHTNRFREAGLTVMLVHHTRKDDLKLSNKSYGEPKPDDDIRGSGAIAGTYEVHLAVRSYNTGLGGLTESFMIASGKEFAPRAYKYGFDFISEKQRTEYGEEPLLTAARLKLARLSEIPYVPPLRRNRKEEI